MKREVTNWLVWNSAFVAAVFLATTLDVQLLNWLVASYVWFMLLMYVVVLFSKDEEGKARSRRSPVPEWTGWLVDIAVVGMLLYAGWYLTSLAYIASCATLASILTSARAHPR